MNTAWHPRAHAPAHHGSVQVQRRERGGHRRQDIATALVITAMIPITLAFAYILEMASMLAGGR